MTSNLNIPFHLPRIAQSTQSKVADAILQGHIQGDGPLTKAVTQKLEGIFGCKVLLTHSCTAALEMGVRLLGIGPGDEVIVPDFTFSSSAAAIAIAGATPVFVDVSRESLNVDPEAVRLAITPKTRAIMVVHYGGVPADMAKLSEIAKEHELEIIEDAAQAFGVSLGSSHLGSLGRFGAISFHGTKNIQAGEGGALLIPHESDFRPAEILREKGTDRSAFIRGEVDKYTWREIGSSYLPSELTAAYLDAQLEEHQAFTLDRKFLWSFYKDSLGPSDLGSFCRVVATESGHLGNGHVFALVFKSLSLREQFTDWMRDKGIGLASHYVPLHQSPAGRKYGRTSGGLSNSIAAGQGLVRFPMHPLASEHRDFIIESALGFFSDVNP